MIEGKEHIGKEAYFIYYTSIFLYFHQYNQYNLSINQSSQIGRAHV